MNPSILATALKTIRLEAQAIEELTGQVSEDFTKSVELIFESRGRLIVSGIGKSALIAQKIVATLNSTGTGAVFMHAADAIHGDLGMIREEDIVLIISKSGESPEIKVLLPLLKNFGNPLIGMVGNINSFLARQCNYILNTTVSKEACTNNLAPTSSTTAQMVMGDAIAVCLMELKGFSGDDFAKIHPGGNLGKRLYLRVRDLFAHNMMPKVLPSASLREVIMEMTKNRLGATVVADNSGNISGIITDGDLRRMLEKNVSLEEIRAENIQSANPKKITADQLAVTALDILRTNDISQLVVVNDNNQYEGMIHLHDLVREGII